MAKWKKDKRTNNDPKMSNKHSTKKSLRDWVVSKEFINSTVKVSK
jgi:hypothetical protein